VQIGDISFPILFFFHCRPKTNINVLCFCYEQWWHSFVKFSFIFLFKGVTVYVLIKMSPDAKWTAKHIFSHWKFSYVVILCVRFVYSINLPYVHEFKMSLTFRVYREVYLPLCLSLCLIFWRCNAILCTALFASRWWEIYFQISVVRCTLMGSFLFRMRYTLKYPL
jgi:hypothetical protein